MTLQAGNPEVTTVHLLAALLDQKDGVVVPIIDRIGANRGQLQEIVQSELDQLPRFCRKSAIHLAGSTESHQRCAR